MRRIPILIALILALVTTAATAGTIQLGAGVYGGVSVPVLNDLSKQGTQFGVRVPVALSGLVTLEPYYTQASLGDATQTVAGIDYTRDGGDLKNFGVNALFTFGTSFSFYPWIGIGSYQITRSGADDINKMGYQGGLGFGIRLVPKLVLHIRGGLDVVSTNGTSQKFAEANAGVSYAFTSF
ncbi:MAG: outer membrane beta-barrel protein [Candidatus Eisenbacteria bacterium]